MQLSRCFETGEAEWSEFRLTTARSLTEFGLGSFCRGKAPSKTDSILFFAVCGEKSEGRPPLNFPPKNRTHDHDDSFLTASPSGAGDG